MVIDSKNLCSGQNRHLRNLTHLVKKTKEGNRDWSEEKMKHGTKFLCSRDNGDPLWEFCQYDSDLRFSLSHGDGFKNHLYKENEEGYSLAQELMTYLQSNYGEKNE